MRFDEEAPQKLIFLSNAFDGINVDCHKKSSMVYNFSKVEKNCLMALKINDIIIKR